MFVTRSIINLSPAGRGFCEDELLARVQMADRIAEEVARTKGDNGLDKDLRDELRRSVLAGFGFVIEEADRVYPIKPPALSLNAAPSTPANAANATPASTDLKARAVDVPVPSVHYMAYVTGTKYGDGKAAVLAELGYRWDKGAQAHTKEYRALADAQDAQAHIEKLGGLTFNLKPISEGGK